MQNMQQVEKPLRRRDRELVERVVSSMIEIHQDATCADCGKTMPAVDMSWDENDLYHCDDCLRPKTN